MLRAVLPEKGSQQVAVVESTAPFQAELSYSCTEKLGRCLRFDDNCLTRRGAKVDEAVQMIKLQTDNPAPKQAPSLFLVVSEGGEGGNNK